MYYSLQKAMHGRTYMFTRILHSMEEDELVGHIPTVMVKPRCDTKCKQNE